MLAQPPRLTDRRTTAGLDADVRFALVMCDSPAEAFTRLEAKKQTRMQLSLAAERAALASLKAELISMGGDLPPITTAPTASTRPVPAVPERPRTTAQEMDVKDFYKIKSESPHSRVRVPTVLHEDFRAKHFEARIKQQAECYTEVIVPYLRYIDYFGPQPTLVLERSDASPSCDNAILAVPVCVYRCTGRAHSCRGGT